MRSPASMNGSQSKKSLDLPVAGTAISIFRNSVETLIADGMPKSKNRRSSGQKQSAPRAGSKNVIMSLTITFAGLLIVVVWGYSYFFARTYVADPNDAAQVANGKAVYADHCSACHGAQLQGQPNWRQRKPDGKLPAPPHNAAGHTWHHSDKLLFDVTKNGTAATAPPGYKTDMAAFGGNLTDEDIWAVLAYIKSTWPPEIQARQSRLNKSKN